MFQSIKTKHSVKEINKAILFTIVSRKRKYLVIILEGGRLISENYKN